MKELYVYVTLLIFSNPGLAEVHIDNFTQTGPSAHSSPDYIIKHEKLEDLNGLLFNPVCTGALQSSVLIIGSRTFFEGSAGTRVIDRGDGDYLLMQKSAITEEKNLATTARAAYPVYAELEFNSVTEGTFVLRAAPDFFSGSPMGASSCLATTVTNYTRLRSEF